MTNTDNEMQALGLYIKASEAESDLQIQSALDENDLMELNYHSGRKESLKLVSDLIDKVLNNEPNLHNQMPEKRMNNLDVEIWDRWEFLDLDESDRSAYMAITIYNGDTSAPCQSLEIDATDAMSITQEPMHELHGYTQWLHAGELLSMNLPKPIMNWAVDTISEFLEIDPKEMRSIYKMVYGLDI